MDQADVIALLDSDPVAEIEKLALLMPQVHLSTSHVVHGGMCARTILIPAGTFLTGAITNADNICVVYGDIEVTTDAGPQRLTGFHVLPAAKGFKRAGLAYADTWWATVWPTQLTDIGAIEDEMTSESAQLQTRREGIEYEVAPCRLAYQASQRG